MAFNIVDTTYSGTYSSYFIMPATYSMDTVSKGVCHIVSDIRKLHTIGRLSYDNPLKPDQAQPVAKNQNPFTLDGRQLIPNKIGVYEEFNPRDLEENQLSEQLSAVILDRQVPPTLQNQMIQLLLNRAGEKLEDLVWMGSKDYAVITDETDSRYQLQFVDGWLKQMVNDSAVKKVASTTAITSGQTCIDAMNGLIVLVTKNKKALITDKSAFKKMKFMMSPTTALWYVDYITDGKTFKGNPLEVGYITPWKGYQVEMLAGMPDNTIVFCRATDEAENTNLFIGMNSMEDWQVKIARTKPADETFFMQAKMKWDVTYGWAQEMFLYTNLTTTDFQVS